MDTRIYGSGGQCLSLAAAQKGCSQERLVRIVRIVFGRARAANCVQTQALKVPLNDEARGRYALVGFAARERLLQLI